MKQALILLSGGVGSRMSLDQPKQYTEVFGKPIFAYSLEALLSMGCFSEVVIVADEAYHPLFLPYIRNINTSFAIPGKRRQDSVFNGLQKLSEEIEIVAIHDAARPFPPKESVLEALQATQTYGASVLAAPSTDTLKQVNRNGFINKGLNRSEIWATQTPQVIRKEFLIQGFDYIQKHHIEVTDDVAILEHLNIPVKIIPSTIDNFKVTYKRDLDRVEAYLERYQKTCATNSQ